MNRHDSPLRSVGRLGRRVAHRWLRRSLGLPLILPLVLAGGCPKPPPPAPPPPEQPAPPPGFAEITQSIFGAWFANHPVAATALGEHRFDGQWPTITPQGFDEDRRRIDDGLAQLQTLDDSTLTAGERVDLDILRSELELQLFAHEVEQPWVRSPLWYAGILGSGLEELVSRDYAPVDERAAAAVSRLQGLPTWCDQAIENLVAGQTMEPHTRVALGQLDGVRTLIGELPSRLEGMGVEHEMALAAASPDALEAVERLRAHVESLLPQATAPWRLGPEHFERKLRLTLQTELSAAEIRRLAVLEHAQIRNAMFELSRELAEVLLPAHRRRALLRGPEGKTAIVSAVLQALSEDRVQPDALRDTIEATLGNLDTFVRDNNLVPLDDAEVLEVIWTPPHQRGVAIAGLAAPGPLDAAKPGLPSFYLVQPVPADWPAADRESFLREYNNFMLEILSIHEAIPGHFVQLYYGKREPSLVRRVLANGAFVEGWAVYTERMMLEAGYSGRAPQGETPPAGMSKRLWAIKTNPELRAKAIALHGLKFYLRTVTNALLDHSIHAGSMDEFDALELMVVRSFQQEGEARAKWTRAQVSSAQLSTYFVGAQAWFRLREQQVARAMEDGTDFDAAEFHREALSHGAPPVHRLPELIAAAGDGELRAPTTPPPDLDSESPTELPAEDGELRAPTTPPPAEPSPDRP